MKIRSTILLLVVSTFALFGQNYHKQKTPLSERSFITTSLRVLVNNTTKVKPKVEAILTSYGIKAYSSYSEKGLYTLTLKTDSNMHVVFTEELSKYGLLLDKSAKRDFLPAIKPYEDQLVIYENEQKNIDAFIKKNDSSCATFYDFQKKKMALAIKKIEAQKSIQNIKAAQSRFTLNVRFFEEDIVGDVYNDSWINMPGIEFSIFKPENPVPGETPSLMFGYNLKYMINYRKTYLNLGLYKSQDKQTEGAYDDMYIFSIGQDFYSKKLGRGKHKFFNLYTSINTGLYILSSSEKRESSWFINPFLGCEIFKNQYIIIDQKVGYNTPFKNNRNFRGLLINTSFNFVF